MLSNGMAFRHLRVSAREKMARRMMGAGRRRVVQIGEGKIFGSRGFVFDAVIALGDRFQSRSVTARDVEGLGFATHGWRLAKMTKKRAA